jgi:hypothetical protein
MTKTYLFLIGWVEGSDSSGGESTSINEHTNLLPEYLKGNEHVFAVLINGARSETEAENYGYKEAFFQNYTAYDTVSDLIEIDSNFNHKKGNHQKVFC